MKSAGFGLLVCYCSSVLIACGFNVDTKFPIIFKSDPESYFGYSVALHKNRDGPVALIGAPKANSTTINDRSVIEPGVLYKCQIEGNQICEEIPVDVRGNSMNQDRNADFSYHDMKNNMWLGVSLDVQPNSVESNIVACAHLWKNKLYNLHYLANGACYVLNEDLNPNRNRISKLVPFVDRRKQAIKNRTYKYAFGQVGTSATFSEDGKYLLLGAPGFHDWKGTVVSYSLDPNKAIQDFKNPAIPEEPLTPHELSPESYVGYSVASGKFYENKIDYVAVGAPRDGGFNGRVYIFETLKAGQQKIEVYQKKEGSQLGEYFGASVLGINLNADEYTDLIVGAPLFSNEGGVDEGKVYVFTSNGVGLQLFVELYGSSKSYARFGTAIGNAGDLNQDGFNDIIIGAPYEDEKGVIYIYHGSKMGLNVQFSQKIAAVEISPSLSGFGIQISRGFDIDSNQYPDILVGAYASSNAVLFRTHSMIQLYSKIKFSPQQINTNMTNCIYQGQNVPCLNVTTCLWYAGKHVPLNLDFKHSVFVENGNQELTSSRAFFLNNNNPTLLIEQTAKLFSGIEFCIETALYIRPQIKDQITPIQILYTYYVVEPFVVSKQFNKSHPIIDPLSPNNTTSAITFQTGCGTDDKCLSDLSLSAFVVGNPENRPLIIGNNDSLSISIEIVNKGDPAYLSQLFIQLPPELPSINPDICSPLSDQQAQRKNASLVCDLGSNNKPIKQEKVNILIKLDLKKVPTHKKEMFIGLEAVTASTEIYPKDNELQIPLYFIAVADISISGSPSHEQIQFDESAASRPIPITHTYFVMNYGPSPVQVIDIFLNIPVSYKKADNIVEFITFTKIESESEKGVTISAKCNDSSIPIQPIMGDRMKDSTITDDFVFENTDNRTDSLDYGTSNQWENAVNASVPTRNRRSNEKRSTQKMKVVNINCQTATCLTIHCSASDFSDLRKFARVSLSVLLNMSALNDILDPWYRIEFNTSGEVSIRDDNSGIIAQHQYPDKILVTTTIVSSARPAQEEVQQWIYFLSIGIGILLLIIILILLIKFGFFKREQKEKMEKLKSNEFEADGTESEALN